MRGPNAPKNVVTGRFAREALGHNNKAVHRAYARRALVRLPSLESFERQAAEGRRSFRPVHKQPILRSNGQSRLKSCNLRIIGVHEMGHVHDSVDMAISMELESSVMWRLLTVALRQWTVCACWRLCEHCARQ